LKIYQNNIFYFFKIIFDISKSKWSENTKNILIWSKEKKFNFFQKYFWKVKEKKSNVDIGKENFKKFKKEVCFDTRKLSRRCYKCKRL
jgi:predicted membrane-bound dolichyl-phosphate-mannose-protein mannosyltransferase